MSWGCQCGKWFNSPVVYGRHVRRFCRVAQGWNPIYHEPIRSRFSFEMIDLTQESDQKTSEIILNKLNIKFEYVYLIHEREFWTQGISVVKLGRTKQEPSRRLAGYPKGSMVYYFMQVNDCVTVENELIRRFKWNFNQKLEFGIEYFEGDIDRMKKLFRSVVDRQ